MHIKRVTLEGFKSYKTQTTLEFSSGTNVVVGRNGSGKSNVFDAIQFVVSDKYWLLRKELRQRLLHEGPGQDMSAAASAYVEVLFDNTDHRFPIEKNEVSLRRVVGLKKDEYILNGKHVSKNDVDSLLEAAGISRSNPYNIVQQGKVSSLIQMKPSDRLELCKEIAGTRIYDDRRKESLRILRDAKTRRERVQEIIDELEVNLKVLEEEKDELTAFQEIDRQKRSLEYTLYDRELQNASEKLQNLEDQRSETTLTSEELHIALGELQEERSILGDTISQLLKNIQDLSNQQAALREQHHESAKQRAAIECESKDLAESMKISATKKANAKSELASIQKLVEAEEAKLCNDIEPRYEAVASELQSMETLARTEQQSLNELFAKQGRHDQFNGNKSKRDAFLKKGIKERNVILTGIVNSISASETELALENEVLLKATGNVEDRRKSIADKMEEWHTLGEKEAELHRARDEKMELRKSIWRSGKLQDDKLKEYRTNFQKLKRCFFEMMPRNIRDGLEAVDVIIREGHVKGVYGPLIGLIEDYDGFHKFFKSVETTAGNRLLYVVVENDTVGARLLQKLQADGSGRVTVMPLNRIRAEDVEYPKSKEAFPMIDRIKFADKFRPAFHQVFGRTLICRDINVATQFSRKYGLDTITMDGDQVSSKGAIRGGFVDMRNSRLRTFFSYIVAEKEMSNCDKNEDNITESLQDIDSQVTHLVTALEKCSADRRTVKAEFTRFKDEVEAIISQKQAAEHSIMELRRNLKEQMTNRDLSRNSIVALQEELASEMVATLTKDELKQLASLQKNVAAHTSRIIDLSNERSKLEAEKNSIEIRLETSLRVKIRTLSREVSSVDVEELSEAATWKKSEFRTVHQSVLEFEGQIVDLDAFISDSTLELQSAQDTMESLKKKESMLNRKLASESKSIHKLLNKKSLLTQKKEKYLRNIRDLGSLPSAAFREYREMTTKELLDDLASVNDELGEFSRINKKALEQHISSSDRQGALRNRIKDVDSGEKSIESLIEHLDQKKEESISKTFKMIAQNFNLCFTELVPGGKGQLIIQTADKEGNISDSVSNQEEGMEVLSRASQYVGIDIRVSFPGTREVYSMQQLSGGQQTIVALSLIFAIQRSDPSPFYLFDEIDANLDAVHRTAVAKMLHQQASSTQFICTTFRTELLALADECYGVTYENKVSRVSHITSQDAQGIITDIENAAREE